MQHHRISLTEESHDVVITCGRDLVHFTVAVLETSSLGLEGFEFPDAEAPKGRYASGRKGIFLKTMVKERGHVVPANEGTVDSHEVDVGDVIHKLEELNLTMGKTFTTRFGCISGCIRKSEIN